MKPARARSSELDQVADSPRASLLREPDQGDEDLPGRDRVGERAMTRLHGDPEEVREPREGEALAPVREQAPRQPDGVEHRSSAAAAGQPLDLLVEERHVEACVVSDEGDVTGEREEATKSDLGARGTTQVRLPNPGQCRDERRQGRARVDERLEGLDDLERPDPDGADLAHAARAR